MMKPIRVVVTGIGAITALGTSFEATWKGLLQGKSGVRRISSFDPSDFPCQIAGEIPDFVPEDFMNRKEARRYPRSTQIALAAATQAVEGANFQANSVDPERLSICFGTAIGGIDIADDGIQALRTHGYAKVNPFSIPSALPNLPAFVIGKQYQALGPSITITTSCATSTQAIGQAAELIRTGKADIVITGGTESIIRDFAIGGFSAMRALPIHYNDSPETASRPFDAKREGFIFSEGAAVLVLESLESAKSRGCSIYAEVAGHSASADCYHIAAPDPSAEGPSRAMRWALKDAGMNPEEIEYINAHGTSTQLNDSIETQAVKNVFREQAFKIPMSSTKSMLGHAMGASGAIEALVCIMVITEGVIPPTINYEYPDPECDLDYVPNTMRIQKIRTALSNSFGLGGQNACVIFKKYTEKEPSS